METLITNVTDGQKKQVKRLAEDAMDRAITEGLLDKNSIQKLIENGDEFQAHIIAGIREFSVSNQFADEEVRSSYTYPKEYKGPKPISEQVDTLAKLFKLSLGLTSEYIEKVLPTLTLPDGAEGWFAIPSVDAVAARFFPEVKDPTKRYYRAVQLVNEKIGTLRSFYNYCGSQITPDCLRVHARTAHALDLIAETQKGDILIVAAQLGMRHRGRSVRRTREVFVANEFGLGSFATGSIILTHPQRLVRWEELDMDCAGDEFAPEAVGFFSDAPIFNFDGGRVGFSTRFVGYPLCRYFGSVSGFLSQ